MIHKIALEPRVATQVALNRRNDSNELAVDDREIIISDIPIDMRLPRAIQVRRSHEVVHLQNLFLEFRHRLRKFV